TNLVSNSTLYPPANPTLSNKSTVKLDDKGHIVVALAGVTDAGGAPVTTSRAYNDSGQVSLDGTEYIVIIKMRLPSIESLIPVDEVPVPVDLQAGKGKTKLSAAPVFGLISASRGRTIEITGSEVRGPLGAGNAAACTAIISSSLPVGLPLGA